MKTTYPFLKLSALIIAIVSFSFSAFAQKEYRTGDIELLLKGTSNIHNWEMKAVKCNSNIEIKLNNEQQVVSFTGLNFNLPAKNLKSEWKAMDNNTYKALKTSANPNVQFAFLSGVITPSGNNNYVITCMGTMSIAGMSKETQLVAKGVYNPLDKSFTVTGIKKLKMTDYNVAPPKALLGTIKTGDDISISYSIKFI